MAGKQSLIILITLALCITSVKANQCKTFAGFDFLNYNELGKLVDKENEIPDAINKKYQILLNTVFCNSDHSNPDNQIKLKQHPKIKEDYFRISHWNIERGMNLDAIIALLKRPEHYFQYMAKEKIKNEDELDDEIKMLQDTDILSLNEVDLGMPRTGYRSVVQELAKALKANYAFVPEFIELDPEFLKAPQINKTKFRGIHGNAIISKYPIEKVSVIRLCDCYDWFGEEKEKLSFLEKARRSSSKLVIEEKIETELRKGSRVALIADIRLPNNQIITVVNVHLENRTQPECRVKQISEILARVKKQSNPVILAGDMNNFEKSAEPVSFKKATLGYLGNPANLARATINAINPYSVVVQPSLTALNAARKLNNPIASDTPVLLPNKTKKFFKLLENFVFDDDAQFDFTGDEHLSYKKKDGELSNSNQRTNSGFVDTFKFKRHFGLGTFKIDWIFAKPIIKDDCLGMQDFEDFKPDCKMYYPAFGRTLKDLNESFSSGRISDHAPVTVEIIVGKESEPKLKRKVKKVKAYMV